MLSQARPFSGRGAGFQPAPSQEASRSHHVLITVVKPGWVGTPVQRSVNGWSITATTTKLPRYQCFSRKSCYSKHCVGG